MSHEVGKKPKTTKSTEVGNGQVSLAVGENSWNLGILENVFVVFVVVAKLFL